MRARFVQQRDRLRLPDAGSAPCAIASRRKCRSGSAWMPENAALTADPARDILNVLRRHGGRRQVVHAHLDMHGHPVVRACAGERRDGPRRYPRRCGRPLEMHALKGFIDVQPGQQPAAGLDDRPQLLTQGRRHRRRLPGNRRHRLLHRRGRLHRFPQTVRPRPVQAIDVIADIQAPQRRCANGAPALLDPAKCQLSARLCDRVSSARRAAPAIVPSIVICPTVRSAGGTRTLHVHRDIAECHRVGRRQRQRRVDPRMRRLLSDGEAQRLGGLPLAPGVVQRAGPREIRSVMSQTPDSAAGWPPLRSPHPAAKSASAAGYEHETGRRRASPPVPPSAATSMRPLTSDSASSSDAAWSVCGMRRNGQTGGAANTGGQQWLGARAAKRA